VNILNDALIEPCRRVQPGQFVRLRPIRLGDAELTLGWRMSRRAALLNAGAQSVGEQANWISRRPVGELNYIIETTAEGVSVGTLSLVEIDLAGRGAEPARFLIGEEERCRGLPAAVEALKLLYGVAFDQLGLLSLSGCLAQDNRRMLKWHKYMGMEEVGLLERRAYINGREQGLIGLRLSRADYTEVTLPRMNRLIALATRGPNANKES